MSKEFNRFEVIQNLEVMLSTLKKIDKQLPNKEWTVISEAFEASLSKLSSAESHTYKAILNLCGLTCLMNERISRIESTLSGSRRVMAYSSPSDGISTVTYESYDKEQRGIIE
ncbi:MAG: hypothetical protein ACYDHG_10190 [Desulfomonilaceae bacterium]